MKIGFCAIWKNKLSEYHAKEEEEIETTLKISQCFIKAKKLGIKIYGLHNIRWASDEQYFTFWECPSFDILEEIISDLEKAGDFKFAKSSHFIGTEFLNLKSNKNYSPDEKFNFGLMLFIKSIKKFEKLAGNFLFDKLDQLFLKNNLMSERCYKSKSFGSWDYFFYIASRTYEDIEIFQEKIESIKYDFDLRIKLYLGVKESNFRFGRNYQLNYEWAKKNE
tara:strand:- start:6075 stop:6737 length:663 start_codon:yes stop_codon:yes gene_type:complete